MLPLLFVFFAGFQANASEVGALEGSLRGVIDMCQKINGVSQAFMFNPKGGTVIGFEQEKSPLIAYCETAQKAKEYLNRYKDLKEKMDGSEKRRELFALSLLTKAVMFGLEKSSPISDRDKEADAEFMASLGQFDDFMEVAYGISIIDAAMLHSIDQQKITEIQELTKNRAELRRLIAEGSCKTNPIEEKKLVKLKELNKEIIKNKNIAKYYKRRMGVAISNMESAYNKRLRYDLDELESKIFILIPSTSRKEVEDYVKSGTKIKKITRQVKIQEFSPFFNEHEWNKFNRYVRPTKREKILYDTDVMLSDAEMADRCAAIQERIVGFGSITLDNGADYATYLNQYSECQKRLSQKRQDPEERYDYYARQWVSARTMQMKLEAQYLTIESDAFNRPVVKTRDVSEIDMVAQPMRCDDELEYGQMQDYLARIKQKEGELLISAAEFQKRRSLNKEAEIQRRREFAEKQLHARKVEAAQKESNAIADEKERLRGIKLIPIKK